MTAIAAPAVEALRGLITRAVPPGTEVFDGPAAEDRSTALRAVTVGAAFQDDQDAVSVERSFHGAKRRALETLNVACSIYVGAGDSDPAAIPTLRGDAAAILGAIDSALTADRTLGGAVGQAILSSASWVQGRDVAGAGVYVGFIVTILAIS